MGEAASLGLVGSAASILASVARSKVTAIVLGPIGIGKMAEIQQLVTLANVPAGMVLGPALVTRLAEARRTGDRTAAESAAQTAVAVALVLSAAGAIIATLSGLWLLPKPWGRDAWPLTLIAGVGALASTLASVPSQILTAYARLRLLTVLGLIGAGVTLSLTCVGTILYGLPGLFAAMALSAIVMLPVTIMSTRRAIGLSWWPRASLNGEFVRRALAIGATTLVGGAAMQFSLFAIRWTLEARGGPAANGQFQAAWVISSTYFGLVLSGLGNYVFPRYAAAQSPSELNQEVEAAAKFVFRVAPALILAAIALRGLVVQALYSHRFDDAVEIVGFMMAGDVAKAISWIHAGPLLYRGRVRAYLITELSGALGLTAGSIICVQCFGIVGIGYAYVFTYVGYAILTAIVINRSCGVLMSWLRLAVTLAMTAGAFGTVVLTRRFDAARWVVLSLAVAWLWRAGVLASGLDRVRSIVARLGWFRPRGGHNGR
jgi:PST family polysaccharide transporter